jgi:GABA(A) receptor-associated protein
MNISFETIKDQFTEEQSANILTKYKNKVPIIIWEIHDNIELDKRKFIVSKDLSIGQFLYVIRKRCKISSEEGLFMFIHTPDEKVILAPNTGLVGIVYSANNIGGFLRVSISKENTFG